MKNQKIKNILYQVSCLLILLGAIVFYFHLEASKYIVLIGVAGFSAITFTTPYPGKSLRGKRLYNMQIFACLFMVASSYLLFAEKGYWLYTMIAAAVLILYSAFLIPLILKKEEEEKKSSE